MADTETFATLDAEAAPVDWTYLGIEVFGTVDSAAVAVPMAGSTIGAQTISFPSVAYAVMGGRFRISES